MSYYHVLGVSSSADRDEIKEAYRKKVKEYHPDSEDGDRERFMEIQEAYETLSDEDSRRRYDRWLDGRESGLRGEGDQEYSESRAGGRGGLSGGRDVRGKDWSMVHARTPDGEFGWFVVGKGEGGRVFLDGSGQPTESPIYFGHQAEAEMAFDRFVDRRSGLTGSRWRRGTDGDVGYRRQLLVIAGVFITFVLVTVSLYVVSKAFSFNLAVVGGLSRLFFIVVLIAVFLYLNTRRRRPR